MKPKWGDVYAEEMIQALEICCLEIEEAIWDHLGPNDTPRKKFQDDCKRAEDSIRDGAMLVAFAGPNPPYGKSDKRHHERFEELSLELHRLTSQFYDVCRNEPTPWATVYERADCRMGKLEEQYHWHGLLGNR